MSLPAACVKLQEDSASPNGPLATESACPAAAGRGTTVPNECVQGPSRAGKDGAGNWIGSLELQKLVFEQRSIHLEPEGLRASLSEPHPHFTEEETGRERGPYLWPQ